MAESQFKSFVDVAKEKILKLEIPEDEIKKIAEHIIESKTIIIEDKDPYFVIYKALEKFINSLKYMTNENIIELYKTIEDTHDNHIEFNIVRSPLSERLIAHVTELRWNGIDLLSGEKIMLYKSSGLSRGTGLEGYWMPYTGERYNRHVAKLEDIYIFAVDNIIRSNTINPTNKQLLIDIVHNILDYNHYMRFINKKHLIASYLLYLNSDAIISNPAYQHHIREYTDEEKTNALKNIMKKIRLSFNETQKDYIPITAEIIDEIIKPPQSGGSNKYYLKYIKYKVKYNELKNII